MTSTNDGKEVKSNLTSGAKVKSFYIELYRSLEAGLSKDSDLPERTRNLCDAWRRVHSLCAHSAASTHPHLLSWLQRHTARTVLQTEWQQPENKNEHKRLEEAIDDFIKESQSSSGGEPAWQTQLVARGEWFKRILANPWGHPVLRVLLDSTRKQSPKDEEILEWLKEERGVMFVTRLRQLASSKDCKDLALELASSILNRVRACLDSPRDDQPDDPKEKPMSYSDPTFEDILKTEAGFTNEVMDLLIDIEFVLLHKRDHHARCIELAKLMSLRNGYLAVERLQSRLESSPREKKLWKNAKDVATLIAQVVVTRCMVVPLCAGASCVALGRSARALSTLVPRSRLPVVAAALAAPAATARHLHTLAVAVETERKDDMKPFVCELYVRAITAGMNELERLKLKTDKESEARTYEQTLSQWFKQLGALLSASERLRCECNLTAFSVHPSPSMYASIHAAPALPPVALDIEPKSEQTTSEFGSWASDSRSQTNLVKTSETLNLKQTQHQTNVLSTAILSEGEALDLSPDLCQDITVLLSGPRVKTLSWDMDRELLLENCRAYMERTKFGTQAVTTELKYLNLDPRNYQHLPEEDDDDNDMYYGIEKGYEHLVEFQEPEEIWQDANNDPERTESAHTTDIEIEVAVSKSKSRKKHKKIISSEEDDPLSSVAEAKRIEKKKERPHSKERSKERKPKTKTKLKEKDPLALDDVSTDINPENQSTERKSDHSLERMKESGEKRKEGAEKKKEGAEKKREGGEKKREGGEKKKEGAGKKKDSSNRKKDRSAERKKEPKDKEKKGKKERKRKEKTVQSQSHSSSLSSLIGMKVGNLGDRKPATSTMTDSDYDSQGKYSINSLLSEGNETDVIFDGLFSMDELKSPEKTPDNNDKMGVMRNNEVHITNGAVKIVGPEKRFETTRVPTPTNRTEQQLSTITDDVKNSITKLIQFRRSQKYSNKNKQPQEHLTDPPRTYMKKPYSEQQTELRNDINSHLNTQEFSPRPVIQYNQNPKPILYNNTPTTGVKILNAALQSPLPKPSTSREVKTNQKTIEMLNRQNPTQADLQLQKQESKIFHDFLKDLQASINAGAGGKGASTPKKDIKPMNRVNPVVPKSEPKVSPSAKQTVKKPEVAPNTFSRLSYYKNKNENKTKRIVEAIKDHQSKHLESQLNVPNLELLLTEHRNAKAKYLQTGDTVIKPSRPSENAQKVIKKTPSTSREHPFMSSLLQSSPNLAKTQVVHNDRPWDMSTTQTNRLSSSSEQDLMRLLRQQSKLNLIRSRPETPKDNILPPPTITSNLLPAHQNNIPSSKKINIIDCSSNILPAHQNNIPSSKKINIIDCKSVIINPSLSKLNTSTKSDEVRSTVKSKVRNESRTKNVEQIHTSVSKVVKDVIDSEARNIKTKTNTKHADPTKQTDWESVMDALLKHKTPSRGPNALDMALNKDSSYMGVFENSLRNQRIVRPPSSSSETIEPTKMDSPTIRTQSVIDNMHSPNILRRSNTDNKDNKHKMTKQSSKVQKVLSNPALEVRSNSGALQKPQHSGTIPVLATEQKKIIVDSRPKTTVPKKLHTEPKKQQFTCPVPKEDDPFISGNLNSDYDLLEDLIDDELRKEIGESLLSDEDNFSSIQSLKDPKAFVNVNKTINTVIQPNKQTLPPPLIKTVLTRPTLKKSCNNAPKPAPKPTTPIQQTTGYVNVNTVTNTQYAKVQTMPTIQTTNIIHQIPKSVIVPPMTEQTYVNTVTSIDQTYVAVPQPTALQNVVLIGSELVYRPCVQAPVHAGVAQNTYVTFNSQPNIAVYQTTQFAAPVVNPLIIGNAITTPSTAVAVPTQNVVASTVAKAAKTVLPVVKEPLKSEVSKLVNDVKIDIKKALDYSSHDEAIVKEKCDVNCNKNCERKVLSEVQEKLIEKIDSKAIKNRRLSFEHDVKKTADQERLKKKRMAILNRSIDHRSDNKPIPLSYSPLKNKKTEISKTQESPHNLRNTVIITDKVNDTSLKLESLINTKVKTIKPDQIKINEKDANENCKENKNETEPCRRILLRSSNKLNSASAEKLQNVKAAPRKTKVRLKVASESAKPEEIKSEVKKTKLVKRAPKKTLNKTIKKVVVKKRITRQTTKNNTKVNSEVEEKPREEDKVTIDIEDKIAIVVKENVTNVATDKTANVEKEAVFADSIPELMDIEDQILGSMILKTGTTETPLTDVADMLSELEENENFVDGTSDVYDNSVRHGSPVSNVSSPQPIQDEIDASKSNDNNVNTEENTERTNLDVTSNEATQIINENTNTEIQDNKFIKNAEVDNVPEPQNLQKEDIETNTVEEPMITDNVNKEPMIADNVNIEPMLTDNVNKELMITDNVNEEPMITDNVNKEPMITDNVNKEPMITDNVNKEPMITDNVNKVPETINEVSTENIDKSVEKTEEERSTITESVTTQDEKKNQDEADVICLDNYDDAKCHNGKASTDRFGIDNMENIPKAFLDAITVHDLPTNDPRDPLKKCVRIKLPNGRAFKATVRGQSNINVDTLFADPGLKSVLLSNVSNKNRYTLNIKQVSTSTKNEPGKILETKIQEIVVQKPRNPTDNIETINLLSDDEDDENDVVEYFETEFGRYKVPAMNRKLHESHQKIFNKKCIMKLQLIDEKDITKESIPSSLNIIATTNQNKVPDVETMEPKSVSEDLNMFETSKESMVIASKSIPPIVAPMIRDTTKQTMNPEKAVPQSVAPIIRNTAKQIEKLDVIAPKSILNSVVSGTNKQATISDVITPKSPDSVVSGTNEQTTNSNVITPKSPDSVVSGTNKQTTISDVVTPKSPDSVVSGTNKPTTILDVITPKSLDSVVSGNKQTTISDVIMLKPTDSVVSDTNKQTTISDVITPKSPDSVLSGTNKQTTISDTITPKSVPVHMLPNCQNVTPKSIPASMDSGLSKTTVNVDMETPKSVPTSMIPNVEDTTKQVKNPEVIVPKSALTSVLPNIVRNPDVIISKSIHASVTGTTKQIINPDVKTLKPIPTSVTSLIRDITKQIRKPDITNRKSILSSVVSGTTKPKKLPEGITYKSIPAPLPKDTPKQLINSLPKGIIVSNLRSSEPEVIEIDDSSNDDSCLSGDENLLENPKTVTVQKSCEEKILEFKNLLLKDLGVQDTDTVEEASVDFIIPDTEAEEVEEFSEMIVPDSPITELIIPDNLKSDENYSNNAHKHLALNPCYVKLTNCDDLVERYNNYKLLKPCSIVLVRCDDNIPESNPNPEISEDIEEPLSSPVNFNTERFVDDDMTPNTLSRCGSFSILNDYSVLDLPPLSEEQKRSTSPVMEAFECIAALGNRHTGEFTKKYEQGACEADWFLCKSRIHFLNNSRSEDVFEFSAASSINSNISEVHTMNAPSLVKILTTFFQDNRMLDNYNPTYKETPIPQVSPTHNLKRKYLDKFQNVGKISKRNKFTSPEESKIESVQAVTDSLETPKNVGEDIVIDKEDNENYKDAIAHKLQPRENIQITEITDSKVSSIEETRKSMSEIHNSATPEQLKADIIKRNNVTVISADEKQLVDSNDIILYEPDMTRTGEEKLNEETYFSQTIKICESTSSDFQINQMITSTFASTIKHTTIKSTQLASEPESRNEDEDIIIISMTSPEVLQNEESVGSTAGPEPQQRTNEVMITKSNIPEDLRESGYKENKNVQTTLEEPLQNFDIAQEIDTVSSTDDLKVVVDSSSNNTQNESTHKLEVRDKNQDNINNKNDAEIETSCAFNSILEDINNAVNYSITQEADSTEIDICVESSDNPIQVEANTLPEVKLSAAEVCNDSIEYLIPNEPRTETIEIESETVNNTSDNVISSSEKSKIKDPVLSSGSNEQRNEGDSKTNIDVFNNIASKLEKMFGPNNQDENCCEISELLEEQNKRVTRLGDLIDHEYTLNDRSKAKENMSDKSMKKESNRGYDEIHIEAITVSNTYSDSENALIEDVVDIHSDELLEEELAHIVLGLGASGNNDEKRESETTYNKNNKNDLLEILETGVQTTSTIEDYTEKEDSNKAEELKEHYTKSDKDKIVDTDLITIGETCALLQDIPKSLVTDIVEIHNNDELELELARIVLGNTDSADNEQQILIINTDNLGYDEVKVCCIQQSELKKMVESENHDINSKLDMIEYETAKGSSSSFQDYVDYTQSSEDILQITQEIDEYGNVKEIDIKLNVPKTTYSKKYIRGSFNYQDFRGLKRKSDMTDARAPDKKYRKGKNIDTPKLTKAAILETTYVKEFNRLFDYCSSVKFSYSRPFHKEDIDVDKALRLWPSGEICDVETDSEINENLFSDSEIVPTMLHDPLNQTLAEEIVAEYNESDYSPSSGTETNFQMGFGEGSGRVIQNSEDDGGLKFSAATLSDVKQTQPLLLSENHDNCNSVPDVNIDTTKQEIETLQRNYKCIQLKDKVRSFFKKTMVELNNDWIKQNKKQEVIYLNGGLKADKSSFPFGLNMLDFINPPPVEVVIQVVQVGQLPVSAAAQNPVTCDPRVTQVSDASPSQCSADNGASDDPHSDIKTEYTELTTADISLPLQDYAQHHSQLPVESQNSSNIMHHDFVIEEIKEEIKEEIEEETEINDEVSENFDTVIANNEPSPSENNIDNNVDYTYETSPSPQASTPTQVEANMEVMYSALETNQQSQITQNQPAQFPQNQIVQPNQHALNSQQNRQEQKKKGNNAQQKQQTHIVQQSFHTQFPLQNQQAKLSPQNQQIQFVNQNQQPQTQVQISQPNQQVLVTQQNQQVHIQQNQQHTIHSQQNQQAPVAQQNAQTHLPQQSPQGQLPHQNSQTQQQNSQEQQNGSPEKTDQIAHAMNAAGITTSAENLANTRAQALVNILSQKLRQGAVGASSTNSYPKTTQINAMALQHALAQILPPPLNQTNVAENNQQSTTNTPQVLHIVQGKNASGNQITLVDNGQPSVISTPNATPVLHIVQNKANSSGPTTNGTPAQQTNTFSGLSLVDAGLQQGNQLLHIVNAGNQKNTNAGQLLRKVNLLTNLTNVQGSNEQKMVQFVCKSADGKSIQLNSPHPRGMVLRLQPVESPSLQLTQAKPVDSQDLSPAPSTPNNVSSKETGASQQEIKSRSVYEENYAKFIQSSNKPTVPEKATSLPKFGQAFGKQVFQDGGQKNDINNSNSHLSSNSETPDCQPNDNAINLDHISQISSPPLLLRKSPQTSQSQPNLVQQLKQTISPMNMSMHGGVIYTRQIPVNIGGGQTINLITVPSTDLIDDSTSKHQTVNQDGIEPSIIKIVPQTPASSSETSEENNSHLNVSNETIHTTQPQQVLTQMRIKLPMLSKTPQMVGGTRLVRPSFFQIQRNVISGANQPVYQQLVLTAAPPLGQQTIRLPQAQTTRHIKVPSESQSSSESQMSSSTLEQLREFDLVLEQVKERSTGTGNGPPSATPSSSNTSFSKLHAPSTDTTDSPPSVSSAPAETTQQVLYSIGNSQPLNVTYVNRKAPSTTTTTSTFARSPDSSGIVESPTSSTHQQIPHTVTSDTAASDTPTSNTNQTTHTTHTTHTTQPKPAKVKPKSRPKASSNPPNTLKLPTVPPKTSTQKPAEDEQTTQRILYILAEYKEQVENSPDKDKPAPRRRTHPPSNPGGSSKRKKSSSGSRRSGRDMSPCHGEDTCRTMGSEDSSCGTSQGDCNESCIDSHSPQDSPRKVVRKLTYEQETPPPVTQPRPQPQRNVIVADGQTITVARGTAGKPTTAVLMPANYILPVSMVKGGQQIAIVTNRGPKLLTVGGGEGGATNALLLQRLIGPAGLKPVLARPGVRHVRLPTAALHNLHAFNLATTTTIQPPDSTASPAPAPTPPDLIDTRASSSPWRTERESRNLKPERGSSPEGSEPWHLPPSEYCYEETVRSEHMDRTVLDPIPDRYSPDMEAQRIFDKMFDVDSKKSYMVDSHDDSPRCGYDIDASDCDDKAYHQVVHKKDGSSHRQHRLTHVSAAALRHKYAILEHELRLQKSLSEECEDLGVDSPSASELFPEAELLFAASPAHDHTQDQGHHTHTPQPLLSQSGISQPDLDDQIATDQLLPRSDHMHDDRDLGLGLEDVGIVTVSEDGLQATIQLDQEEFARSHPNTTFHSEPTDDGEVQQPFTLSSLKARHVTSTIFHSNRPHGTVLMTAPQTTVISQATAESSGVHHNAIKYSDIDNMINSLPGAHTNSMNLSSVLVKDDGLSRFDNLLNDSRELHLSNTASAIVHSSAHTTQVIRRVCYEDDKRERDNRFLMDEPDGLIAGDDAKMMGEDSSRDATLESVGGDTTGSSPERHTELFWDSHSASGRADFSSDSEKCCKSPSDDTSTDSSAHAHMRLDSVIKEARGIASDEDGPPLRTYPAPRSLSGKTAPTTAGARRRASGRGVVKRGTCLCCVGEPAPPRAKKPRQRRQPLDFAAAN